MGNTNKQRLLAQSVITKYVFSYIALRKFSFTEIKLPKLYTKYKYWARYEQEEFPTN